MLEEMVFFIPIPLSLYRRAAKILQHICKTGPMKMTRWFKITIPMLLFQARKNDKKILDATGDQRVLVVQSVRLG